MFDHIGLRVRNIAASARFYRAALAPLGHEQTAQDAASAGFGSAGNTGLWLVQTKGQGERVVTFGNGMVARELIVDLDDTARRLAWSVVGGRMTHHNASLQVFAEGEHSRAVWIADLLPHELGPAIGGMIAQGLEAMKKTLETA